MRNKPESGDSQLLIVLSEVWIIITKVIGLKMNIYHIFSILVEGGSPIRKGGNCDPTDNVYLSHTHCYVCLVLWHLAMINNYLSYGLEKKTTHTQKKTHNRQIKCLKNKTSFPLLSQFLFKSWQNIQVCIFLSVLCFLILHTGASL